MKVERVVVGYLDCNCYILDIDGNVIVIDPGDEAKKIEDKIAGRNVLGIIITHNHFDHIGALEDIVNKYKCLVYDRYNLIEGENNIGEFYFNVIYTPGHKEDAITIYFRDEKIMFTGDFIFKDSVGRWDMDGGSFDNMIESIKKIKLYDRDIILYPGHGEETRLGYEIDNNIYFRDDLEYL